MSNTQTIIEVSARERGKLDDRAQGQRYTPLRSFVIARALRRETDSSLAHSPIVPERRFRYSA
jgi:hypothetical protein